MSEPVPSNWRLAVCFRCTMEAPRSKWPRLSRTNDKGVCARCREARHVIPVPVEHETSEASAACAFTSPECSASIVRTRGCNHRVCLSCFRRVVDSYRGLSDDRLRNLLRVTADGHLVLTCVVCAAVSDDTAGQQQQLPSKSVGYYEPSSVLLVDDTFRQRYVATANDLPNSNEALPSFGAEDATAIADKDRARATTAQGREHEVRRALNVKMNATHGEMVKPIGAVSTAIGMAPSNGILTS